MPDVTRLLSQISSGDPSAAEELLPLVYNELRSLAAAKLIRERPGQTLQATALVHEAYLRLVGGEPSRHWDSGRHFYAAAAEAMRRILALMDHPHIAHVFDAGSTNSGRPYFVMFPGMPGFPAETGRFGSAGYE